MVFIDHAGYDMYRLASEAEAAITVGDDTTSVVGDILYRFQKPILGITDGDRDSLLENVHIQWLSRILKCEKSDRCKI